MFMARYQARDVADVVADYLKSKPSATSGDLQAFVTNLGFGTLKNTESGGENNVYDKITIKSEKTMKTAAEFDALCNAAAVKAWTNPFLSDSDASNDNNPYYIHICYRYTYNAITPLSNLTGGAVPKTMVMKNKALAYIAPSSFGGAGGGLSMSCPTAQVMTGFNNGSPVCSESPGSTTASTTATAWYPNEPDTSADGCFKLFYSKRVIDNYNSMVSVVKGKGQFIFLYFTSQETASCTGPGSAYWQYTLLPYNSVDEFCQAKMGPTARSTSRCKFNNNYSGNHASSIEIGTIVSSNGIPNAKAVIACFGGMSNSPSQSTVNELTEIECQK
jgi:hypothetical protein